jgi:stage V sporulation protein R
MEDDYIKALEDAMDPIWEIAHGFGLDPFPVHYELVPAAIMYEFGSYGLPGRFSHWSHGKVYHRMKTSYDYGLSKIYELVINTNPSYAFLMEGNSLVQNKLVMAHVLGHCDFFKHNSYFARTNRSMVETASLNAARIRDYENEHGLRKVERFMDAVLSIQEHVDPHANLTKQTAEGAASAAGQSEKRFSEFDDLFSLTPEDAPAPQDSNLPVPNRPHFPAEPEKDLVGFIMEHSRYLEPWQRDVIGIIRQEMLYFVPQMQTKICNEGWACATGDSLLLTEHGFVRFDDLYDRRQEINVAAGGSGELFPVTDYHKEDLVPTIRIKTRRGLTIEGSPRHRVLLADGSWGFLSDLKLGDRVVVESGTDIWPLAEQPLTFVPARADATLQTIAATAGVSSWTVLRHLRGRNTLRSSNIDAALQTTAYRPGRSGRRLGTRAALALPPTLSEDLAWLLGYFIGAGNRTKSGICFTCGESEFSAKLVEKVKQTIGLDARASWDPTETGGRWRVTAHSPELLDWLTSIGIDLRDKARDKKIPPIVLRSPQAVMSAFLRGYFDADGYAGPGGIILSSSSSSLVRAVQIILLNYGVLSTQRPQRDGCIQLTIYGASAARFRDMIGFGLQRKQHALAAYLDAHRWFKKEQTADPVVSIDRGFADVYDITVATRHSYVANGFVNHNSFWHARIMRELELTDSDFIEYSVLNAGVVSPSRHSINPYYLGVKMLEHIEHRWDNPTEEEQVKLGRKPGEGRKKLFEVREFENDVSIIRNYMTKQLVDDLDLYLYERQGDQWVIVDKNWENVRDGIVARMANFGNPTILVEDGDYHHNGELYLRHIFDGNELDVVYGEKTLEHVQALWGRPVHLQTLLEGEETLLSYDGEKHARETL